MAKSNKKEPAGAPAWMATFADLMSLLMKRDEALLDVDKLLPQLRAHLPVVRGHRDGPLPASALQLAHELLLSLAGLLAAVAQREAVAHRASRDVDVALRHALHERGAVGQPRERLGDGPVHVQA